MTARGQIDVQKKQIDEQQTEIKEQRAEIDKIKSPKPARHLNEDQRQKLKANFALLATSFPEIAISAPAGDGNANEYAQDFAAVFRQIDGIKVPPIGMLFPTSSQTPGPDIMIVVKDLNLVPPQAELFAKTMVQSGFQVRGAKMETISEDQFILVIGPAP